MIIVKQNQPDSTPRVYVSTYEAYNNGNLNGKWIDLTNFTDADEFLQTCYKTFGNNAELMFQDWDNIPDFLTSETMTKEKINKLFEFLNLQNDEQNIITAYYDAVGNSNFEFSEALETFYAKDLSYEEFAEEYCKECDFIPKNFPDWIIIDWKATWEYSLSHDFITGKDDNGVIHYFRT